MKKQIYADNAATTKLDRDAFEAMLPWLMDNYSNASQPYSFARKPKKAIEEARGVIASCIGAEPEEIFFTSGGTESDNWAIKGSIKEEIKQQIITSQIEHHAVINTCASLQRFGYPVIYLPVDKTGVIDSDELSKTKNGETGLVSIMMVNNEIGTIEPISQLADIAHSSGSLFHTDAVQAVGHIPINVKYLGVDMLSASAHKFNGPKGIGFLYIRKGTQIHPFMDGGAQEKGLRAGTENVASIAGMAPALKKSCALMSEATVKLRKIEEVFLDELKKSNIDFIRNGSENRVPGNINISIKGESGERILHRLDLMGISISTGSACDSQNTQVSHVIKAIKVPKEYAKGTIRISFSKDNTIDEACFLAKSIIQVTLR